MSIHRGQYLENAVRGSGLSLAEIARRLKISRQTMYKYFLNEKLDIEKVGQIGRIIGEPKLMEEMMAEIANPSPKIEQVQEPETDYGDVWKVKYFKLQEKYNAVVLKMFEDLKNENRIILQALKNLQKTDSKTS